MKFHVTIKNNETGKILYDDDDCNAIIGGICKNEKSFSVVLTSCNCVELASCIFSAKKAIDESIPEDPIIRSMVALYGSLDIKEDKEKE